MTNTGVKAGFSTRLYVSEKDTFNLIIPDDLEDVSLARDVTINLERSEIDASSRGGGGWRQRIGGLKDATIDAEILDATGADGYELIRDAFLDNTRITVLALNGTITGLIAEDGTQGLLMSAYVLSFTRNEPLEDVVSWSVQFVAAPKNDDNASPQWLIEAGFFAPPEPDP